MKNFKPYKNGAFCYEDGVLRNGARNRYEATKEEKYLLFVEKYYDRQIDSLGNIPAFKKENHSIDDLQSDLTSARISLIRFLSVKTDSFIISPIWICSP